MYLNPVPFITETKGKLKLNRFYIWNKLLTLDFSSLLEKYLGYTFPPIICHCFKSCFFVNILLTRNSCITFCINLSSFSSSKTSSIYKTAHNQCLYFHAPERKERISWRQFSHYFPQSRMFHSRTTMKTTSGFL